MTGSVIVGLVVLVALILQSLIEGWPRLNLDLLTSFPSSFPDRAGIQSAIFGTLWMVGIVLVTAIPIGVGAAIYMEEFADTEAWYNRFIDVIIQNLAAVPSIVYGILGLAFLSRGLLEPRSGRDHRGPDPLVPGPAGGHHRVAGGDPGGAELHPGRRAGSRAPRAGRG